MKCATRNEVAFGKRSCTSCKYKKAIPSPSGDRIAFLAAKSRGRLWIETRSNGDLVHEGTRWRRIKAKRCFGVGKNYLLFSKSVRKIHEKDVYN